MAKTNLTDVVNILGNPTSAANTINENNALLEAALDKTLSRDGSTPNQMEADLDMNHNDILNVALIAADDIAISSGDIMGILERADEAVEDAEEAADRAELARDEAVAAAGGVAPQEFESRAFAMTQNISNVAEWVTTHGYNEAGDGGAAVYYPVVSAPSHEGYFEDAAGKFYELRTDTVNIDMFGADTTDTTGVANRTAFINAKNYLKAIGGGTIIVPGKTYWMSDVVRDLSMGDHDYQIIGEPGNKVIAVAGLTGGLFTFFTHNVYYQIAEPVSGMSEGDYWFAAAVTNPVLGQGYRYNGTSWVAGPYSGTSIMSPATLTIKGLEVDVSRGVDSGGGQYASAFVCAYYRDWFIEDCVGYGGTIYNNVNADSFCSPISCFNFVARNNRVKGFNDAAYYVGGDNKIGGSSGDQFLARIEGGFIEACAQAVTTKRELYLTLVEGITVVNCRIGCISLPVGTGLAGVGRRLIVSNSFFVNIENSAFQLRGDTRGEFLNNRVEGIGADLINGGVLTNASAVILAGAPGAVIKGNVFERGSFAAEDQRGINIANAVIDGVTYTGGKHTIEGNSYINMGRVAVEGSGVDPSTFKDEVLNNLHSTPFTFTSLNTIAKYTIVGFPDRYTRVGGHTFREGASAVSNKTSNYNVSEADNGVHFTNQGQGSQTTFVLPAAAQGLRFTFTNMHASGIRILAELGDFPWLGVTSGTTNRQAVATAVGSSITFEAIDTTNWIAISATNSGGWTVN